LVGEISAPCVRGAAVSIVSAIQAKTVVHAVSSLSISAISVAVTSGNALTIILVAIDLSDNLTTILVSASGSSVGDNAIEALLRSLTILTKTSVTSEVTIVVGGASERTVANLVD